MKKTLRYLFPILAFLFSGIQAHTQCGPLISSFPYSEGFETSAAWTSGVVAGTNDWAWGTPSHPSINTAGGGLKCWCVGSLTGSSYLNSDQCYIMSPCFDFTTLNNPWISFKIYWECERQWDGMVLQYSLNGGVTWANVGAFGDPVDCLNQNWYNYGNITWLNSLPAGSRNGWSGRTGPTVASCTGGFGSNGWVTAKHCMSNLANQPNVRFRFLFGSGTTCNAYDGEAIDDIYIDNAAPNVANFSWTCTSANSVSFTNLSSPCPTAYSWNFNDPSSLGANTSPLTNPSHTFTGPGTYSVVLIASGPCNASGTITIPVTILGSTITSTNVTCNGANNGTATVNVLGSAGPFTYTWTPSGGNAATATGLSPGTYTVSISAANSCPITQTVSITQPPLLTSTSSQINNLCFGGNSGSATVSVTGGAPTYSYSWSPSGGTNATASGLATGSYTCNITDSHGCITTQSFFITSPPSLTATNSIVNVICNGGNNGSATVVASGGSSGYTYSWSPSGGNASVANGLAAGTYSCTISDSNGCSITQSVTITEPTALSSFTSTTPATCSASNGVATVTASGGIGPYTYLWSPSGGTNAIATNLAAGSYTVTITSLGGCTTTAVAIVSNTGSVTSPITAFSNVSCFGGNNGSATCTVAGGTGPYVYTWSPSGGASATASNLIAGNYSVTVTDAFGCNSTASIAITQPNQLTSTINSSPALCFGGNTGTSSVVVAGGSPSYSYSWNSQPAQNSSTAINLLAGNYTCTITDINGCLLTQSIVITEPPQLTLQNASVAGTCFNSCNGQALVVPAGGTPAYSYQWSSGCTNSVCTNLCSGTYTVTVFDLNGCSATGTSSISEPSAITITTSETDAHCNLSDGSVSANASGGVGPFSYQWTTGPAASSWNNVPSNTYTIVVTDSNSCIDSTTVTVNSLNGVIASFTSTTNLTCFNSNNGSIQSTLTGGTGPYSYVWTPNVSSSNSASGLPAANYTLTVVDANGCTSTITTTITQPADLIITPTSNPSSICAGATSQLISSATGGTSSYNFAWSPGALIGNLQSITPTTTTTYTAYVVDANGCSDSSTVLITVNQTPLAQFSSDINSGCAPVCINFADLSSILSPSAINSWIWDFGDGSPISAQQNPMHCYAIPGSYEISLTVVSSGGCKDSISIPAYINVFPVPVAEFSASPQPTSILNPEVFFVDESTNANSWLWNFGDNFNSTSSIQNPSFLFQDDTCFNVILFVTSSQGCTDSAMHEICIDPEVALYAPNAFTPNHDGKNDFFFPKGEGMDWNTFHMMIFDRWGNLIYETTDINKPWDGRANGGSVIAQQDIYVWKVSVKDLTGSPHNLYGSVALIK